MKFFLITCLAMISTVAAIKHHELPSLLKSWVELETVRVFPPQNFSDSVLECMREILNITDENYNAAELVPFPYSAKLFNVFGSAFKVCSISIKDMNLEEQSYDPGYDEEALSCFKVKLYEIDPTSELLKDFNASAVNKDICVLIFKDVEDKETEFFDQLQSAYVGLGVKACKEEDFVSHSLIKLMNRNMFLIIYGTETIEEKYSKGEKVYKIRDEIVERKIECLLDDLK